MTSSHNINRYKHSIDVYVNTVTMTLHTVVLHVVSNKKLPIPKDL